MTKEEYLEGLNIFNIYWILFPLGKEKLEEEFEKRDLDHDGFINFEELKQLIFFNTKYTSKPFFKKFKLYESPSRKNREYDPLPYNEDWVKKGAEEILKNFDKNNDRKLSLEEYRELEKQIAITYEKKQNENFNIQTRIDFLKKLLQITKEFIENVTLKDVKDEPSSKYEEDQNDDNLYFDKRLRLTLIRLSYLYYFLMETWEEDIEEYLQDLDTCFGKMDEFSHILEDCIKVLESFK